MKEVIETYYCDFCGKDTERYLLFRLDLKSFDCVMKGRKFDVCPDCVNNIAKNAQKKVEESIKCLTKDLMK